MGNEWAFLAPAHRLAQAVYDIIFPVPSMPYTGASDIWADVSDNNHNIHGEAKTVEERGQRMSEKIPSAISRRSLHTSSLDSQGQKTECSSRQQRRIGVSS